MNKKRNNKGFSLVELIVVIAVMAVLVVVLAPAYLRYVDKARVQKDESAVSEVIQAVKIAASEEAVSKEISGEITVKIAKTTGIITVSGVKNGDAAVTEKDGNNDGDFNGGDTDGDVQTALGNEIRATVGNKLSLSSSLKDSDITIKVSQDSNHNLIITPSIKLD